MFVTFSAAEHLSVQKTARSGATAWCDPFLRNHRSLKRMGDGGQGSGDRRLPRPFGRQNLDNCVFHLGEMIAQIVRNINSWPPGGGMRALPYGVRLVINRQEQG